MSVLTIMSTQTPHMNIRIVCFQLQPVSIKRGLLRPKEFAPHRARAALSLTPKMPKETQNCQRQKMGRMNLFCCVPLEIGQGELVREGDCTAVTPGRIMVLGSVGGTPRRSWWVLPRCPFESGASDTAEYSVECRIKNEKCLGQILNGAVHSSRAGNDELRESCVCQHPRYPLLPRSPYGHSARRMSDASCASFPSIQRLSALSITPFP